MWNTFEFSRVWENIEMRLVYTNKFPWIVESYLSTEKIKWALVPPSFSYFLEFSRKKRKFFTKSFSRYNLCFNDTSSWNWFVYIAFAAT